MYKAIFFDLDGTLLHLDQFKFISYYFEILLKKMMTLGLDVETLKAANKLGIKAMKLNDGSKNNAEAYWNSFGKATGADVNAYIALTDSLYTNEYNLCKELTRINPDAKRAVETAKAKNIPLVLATNPMFPRIAQVARLNWAGLDEADFKLITDYESDGFSKPNPKYYLDICKRIGTAPKECLMVGNDTREDMFCAREAGLDTFLVTDCLIEREGEEWDGKRGKFKELADLIENL